MRARFWSGDALHGIFARVKIPSIQFAAIRRLSLVGQVNWSASITLDHRLLDAVFSLEFLDKHEHVLLVGPAGVGKSFLTQALGYSAIRAGYTVRFSPR